MKKKVFPSFFISFFFETMNAGQLRAYLNEIAKEKRTRDDRNFERLARGLPAERPQETTETPSSFQRQNESFVEGNRGQRSSASLAVDNETKDTLSMFLLGSIGHVSEKILGRYVGDFRGLKEDLISDSIMNQLTREVINKYIPSYIDPGKSPVAGLGIGFCIVATRRYAVNNGGSNSMTLRERLRDLAQKRYPERPVLLKKRKTPVKNSSDF